MRLVVPQADAAPQAPDGPEAAEEESGLAAGKTDTAATGVAESDMLSEVQSRD